MKNANTYRITLYLDGRLASRATTPCAYYARDIAARYEAHCRASGWPAETDFARVTVVEGGAV